MDVTIDNQQQTAELAWLAGIVDGEGCILIRHINDKKHLLGRIDITNTEVSIINEVIRIYDKYGINGRINIHDDLKSNHKIKYSIEICRLDSISKLLDLLMPFLIGKKEQAVLLKRWTRIKYDRIERNGGNRKAGVPEKEEWLLRDQIMYLNRKTNRQDAQRPHANAHTGHDMVRSA